jgi:hypothetical protein
MGHNDAALGQDQLDVAQAEAEYVVEPDGVADDLSGEPVTRIRDRVERHQINLSDPARPDNWPST